MLSTEYARRTKAFVLPEVHFESPEGAEAAMEGMEPPVLSYKLNANLLKHRDWIGYLLNSLNELDTCNDPSLEERRESLLTSAKNHDHIIKNHIHIVWSRKKLLSIDGGGSKINNFQTYINCSK